MFDFTGKSSNTAATAAAAAAAVATTKRRKRRRNNVHRFTSKCINTQKHITIYNATIKQQANPKKEEEKEWKRTKRIRDGAKKEDESKA